tara:strand:+ start:908 stop:1213 length:306 start_codon:yes stop_codon:yes gene_type:complete
MADRILNLQQRTTYKSKKYFKNIKYPSIPLSPFDLYVTTTLGDRLDLLANEYYEEPEYWWIISHANPGRVRRDSYVLEPGIEIRIPQNIDQLYYSLELSNS